MGKMVEKLNTWQMKRLGWAGHKKPGTWAENAPIKLQRQLAKAAGKAPGALGPGATSRPNDLLAGLEGY